MALSRSDHCHGRGLYQRIRDMLYSRVAHQWANISASNLYIYPEYTRKNSINTVHNKALGTDAQTQWQTHWEYIHCTQSVQTYGHHLTEKDHTALKSNSQVQSYVIWGNIWPLHMWTHNRKWSGAHTIVGELVDLLIWPGLQDGLHE